RQNNRERGPNVIDAEYNASDIVSVATRQIAHGRYPQNTLYGDGRSGMKIADALATLGNLRSMAA
ncbi:unnamed protein product, partial [Laminaria digitata]